MIVFRQSYEADAAVRSDRSSVVPAALGCTFERA